MSKLIISSWVELYRNYATVPFDTSECEEDGNIVNARCLQAFPECEGWTNFAQRHVNSQEKADLLRIMHRPYNKEAKATSAFFLNKKEHLLVSSNLCEQLEITAYSSGENLNGNFEKCRNAAKSAEVMGNFAFDKEYGFLTKDLGKIGCGMTAGITMHLPVLSKKNILGKVASGAAKYGVEISKSSGCPDCFNLWDVKNSTCIGLDENNIIDIVMEYASKLALAEKEEAAVFMNENPEKIENAAVRAKTLMECSRLVYGVQEAGEWWSQLRCAAENDIDTGISIEEIDEITFDAAEKTMMGADEAELAAYYRRKRREQCQG